MRLLDLSLLAFGPFTNTRLDLSGEGAQIIYGKNEAGKSTALRAITGLFYGIPKNTVDAHLHRMPDLRIGGTLVAPDGKTIEIVRRKGKDRTLLDRDGNVLDEAVLVRFLGGVSQEQFLGMFGLDHETLRRGGEALLLGRGLVGESLFGAAMAGGDLHQVLRNLTAEADSLFTPKGHTKPLNEALRAFTDAEKRTRDEAQSPDALQGQMAGLAEFRRDRAECETSRQRLYVERTRLERARRALPLLAKRRVAEGARHALEGVVLLPPHAKVARLEQMRALAAAESEMTRLEAHLVTLRERRSDLTLPESLIRFDEVPLDLANRLGGHVSATTELPRLATEIAEHEARARASLVHAGQGALPNEDQKRRVDAVTEATIKRLVVELLKWGEAHEHGQRTLAEQRARLATWIARRDALPPPSDGATLKNALLRAENERAEERWQGATTEARRLEARAESELAKLGLSHLSIEEAARIRVPPAETVDRFSRRFDALFRDHQKWEDRRQAAADRLAERMRDIDALERAGHVPSEVDLATTRARRDDAWRALKSALTTEPNSLPVKTRRPSDADVAAFESGMREADEIADRLRRETERVSRLAALRADEGAASKELAMIAERESSRNDEQRAEEHAWREMWSETGTNPRPPDQMRDWLVKQAAFVHTSEAWQTATTQASELAALVDGHLRRLDALLRDHGCPASADLATALDRAKERVAEIDAAAIERRELERTIADHTEQVAALAARDEEQKRARQELDRAWRDAVLPLGLESSATPEQVTVILELFGQASAHFDQAAVATRRHQALEREVSAFRADVAKLTAEHAVDLAGLSAERAAAEIVDRYHRGKTALAARNELDRQIGEAEKRLAEERARRDVARTEIAETMQTARVDSIEALERAERASDEIRALDTSIARMHQDLREMGDPDALFEEMKDLDVDAVTARLADVDLELEQLRENASVLDRRIGSAEAGLKNLENPQAKAADAAVDAEAALARVREIAERYMRVRVASLILAGEIETYRQKNQGPILTRASELFQRLTLNSFMSLRTDFDEKDQPILRGVRTGGADIGVEAMSDGTRDQLYLALRLATIERYAENGNPVPIVLDDILVHFDDDRAAAALELLGDLSDRTQVLFFTHHARIAHLARSGPKLRVREFGDTESRHGSVGGSTHPLLGSARHKEPFA